MLANGAVINEVLERGTSHFDQMVAGRTLVHMGTTAAAYSERLSRDIASAGGRYVEAPRCRGRVAPRRQVSWWAWWPARPQPWMRSFPCWHRCAATTVQVR